MTAPPAPVCPKCGLYTHNHSEWGCPAAPPAPDLSPCPCNQPSDTTHAKAEHAPDDEMRPEYDFREGERGKYFERYNAPPAPERMSEEEFERIARDVTQAFPANVALVSEARRARESEADLDADNEALHLVAQGIKHYWRCKNDAAGGHPLDGECQRCRAEKAEAEVAALKGMIAYALEAPDAEATKTILTDALDGVTGADNVSDVRGERERLRAEVERLTNEVEYLRPLADSAPRLRAALEKIVGLKGQPIDPCDSGFREAVSALVWSMIGYMSDIAREALEGK